jgi:hypothetical protein
LHLTLFELRFGHKPSISHLRHFGCKYFILKHENLDKFESRSFDGILLGDTPLMADLIEFITLRLTSLLSHVIRPLMRLLLVLMISLSVQVTRKWRRGSL